MKRKLEKYCQIFMETEIDINKFLLISWAMPLNSLTKTEILQLE